MTTDGLSPELKYVGGVRGGSAPPAAAAGDSSQAALILAQWFAPGFPSGAFAFSHGLETAIAEGTVTDAAGLHGWIAAILAHGSGRNDALLTAAAWRRSEEATGAARADERPALEDLDALARALAPSAERLAETLALGAAFVRTTNAVWGLALPDLTFPVALGRAARALHLPLPDLLRLSGQAFAANLVSVGVRLIPVGQTDGQRVLAALAPLVLRIAAEAEAGDHDALGGASLLADIQSMRHETQEQRIFRT